MALRERAVIRKLMRPGERAGKRSSSQTTKPRKRLDQIEVTDRQINRLVRAFSAIRSARLRMTIVSFAETIGLPKRYRRHRRRDG
jgi:hypothetical protein